MDLLSVLIKGSSDAVFIADVGTGNIAFANEAACRLIGYPLDELIGMHQTQLHPPEELEYVTGTFKEASTGGFGDDLAHVLHRNGDRIPVRITASDLYIGDGKSYLVGYFKDLTPVKKLEEIAFIQSHIVRAPITTALGLVDLLEDPKTDEHTRKEAIEHIKSVLLDLDKIIKEVVAKTGHLSQDL